MPKNLELSYLIDFYGDVLTEKQRDVMEQYYNDDLSLAEIAENFGITRQGVRDSIKRGEGILLDLEQKIGFASRYKSMQEGLSELEKIARSMQADSGQIFTSITDVHSAADNMLSIIAKLSDQ